MFFIVSSVESLTRTENRLSTSINHVIELYGTMPEKVCLIYLLHNQVTITIIDHIDPYWSTNAHNIDQPVQRCNMSTMVDRCWPFEAWPWGLRCPHQSQLRADGSAVAGWEFFSFLIKAWENWINWIMNISWICHDSCQLVVVQL